MARTSAAAAPSHCAEPGTDPRRSPHRIAVEQALVLSNRGQADPGNRFCLITTRYCAMLAKPEPDEHYEAFLNTVHMRAGNLLDALRLRHSRSSSCVTLLSGIMLLAGCTAYGGGETQTAQIPAMPYSVKEGAVSLGADPHVQSDRQEQIFDADFASLAVLPVQVVVGNSGDQPLRVDPEFFKLSLPGKEATTPRPGSEVALFFPPEAGVAHYATTGVSMLGGLAGPIGAIAGRVAGLLGSMMLSQMDSEAAQGRQDDYARKELKSVQLRRGEFARGFLFFVLPRGTPPFEEAMLSFSVTRDNTEIAIARILLKGLNVKGLPKTDHETMFK
jgi:hypothetical protein